MHQFLLEIGTEELPASFLRPAAEELERRVRVLLVEHEIPPGAAELFYAPRRIAVLLNNVPDGRPARTVEVQGPPRKAAFDADGKPTKTAIGFSAAQGKTPKDLTVKTTPRGEYVFVQKDVPALPTRQVLEQGLPQLILTLPFPKAMRWTEGRLSFARPIRWLLCLLGSEVVRFSIDGLSADNRTFGHRNFSPAPLTVTEPAAWQAVLLDHRVIPDAADRCRRIEAELTRLAASIGGSPVLDEELLTEATGITEFPELILCSFNPEYLDLPADVLITALKKHQRCFCIRKSGGSDLIPHFVAVTNTPGCDHVVVTGWYEKAVESRLRDARFFVQSDLATGLDKLVEDEKQVVWIEGMGSYFDKTERLRELCRHLSRQVPGTDAALLDRAALLSKADLLTNMVREKEFTSLQGIMGCIYARLLKEPAEVADAMADQYLPRHVGDALPRTQPGALLGIADKTDNIVATFLTGAIPTGSEDPFALRRQAIGLLAIILSRSLPVDIGDLVETTLRLFPNARPEYAVQLAPFFRERLAALLAEQGTQYDIAAAVLETSWQQPMQALARAKALAAFRDQPEFERLIIGQKRVANILRGQKVEGPPQPERLVEPTEKQLHTEAGAVEPDLDKALGAHDYKRALELLLGLRPIIDKFFDDVLVMAEDPALRSNRLKLLACVRSLFARVADLSKIVIAGTP